ncbi:FUSC family protein [Pseudomonas aeruginosa]|uniref:FUSC family protein n=1 Tax=Pseudomonas aeruginosa TaxID=287 RepID=UPI00053EB30F|nr:FUSC family protein [Pseudomonas aeruginosa]
MKAILIHYLQPNLRSVLFAAKGLSAVALALAVSMSLDLDKPFWAMVASMMLQARPERGLVIEKALCLVIGSTLGACVAVLILNYLMPYPLLAIGALAVCVATTSAIASTERHVNFIFGTALISVTAILIVMFAMADPTTTTSESIFMLVRARLTEVMVGASCATLASVFLFPFKVETLLAGHTRSLHSACLAYVQALANSPQDRMLLHQKRLEIVGLVSLINDDSNAGRYELAKNVSRSLRMGHNALTLAASGHTVERLFNERESATSQPLAGIAQPFLRAVNQILELDSKSQMRGLRALPDEVQAAEGSSPAADLANASKAFTHALLAIIEGAESSPQGEPYQQISMRLKRHRDWPAAARSATRNALVFVAAATLWVASDGAATLIMMMVLPTLFSQMFAAAPSPTLIVRRLITGVVIAVPVVVFWVLPLIAQGPNHFLALMLALAGPLFLGLMAMTSPAFTPYGLGFCLTVAVTVQPSNYMAFALDQSVSIGLGIIAGLGLLFIGFALAGPPKGLWLQRRVVKSLERDLRVMQRDGKSTSWLNQRAGERLSYLSAYEPGSCEGKELTALGFSLLETGHCRSRDKAQAT